MKSPLHIDFFSVGKTKDNIKEAGWSTDSSQIYLSYLDMKIFKRGNLRFLMLNTGIGTTCIR